VKYLISIILFIVSIFFACTKEKIRPAIDNSIIQDNLPDQESWNSKIFFTDSGKTKAILDAGHLRVFAKTNETLLDSNIKVEFFNMNEIHTTTLTSKRGRVDENLNNLYAFDSVVVVNDSGVVIRSEEMMWRNKDRKIVSDKYVSIVSPKEKIEGFGFQSDQGLHNYVIYDITYITEPDSL
jgi:LPS export ABC transporter protein LptC